MTHETNGMPTQSFFERFLRALIIGTLAMLGLYLKILGGILKLGIRLVRKVPMEADKRV